MIKTKIEISNLSLIDKQVKLMNSAKQTTGLNDFLKDKFLNVLNQVIDERLVSTGNGEQWGVTDSEYFGVYKANNKFQDIPNGFILYNDTVIPQSELPIKNKQKLANYPNGFSLALAFEYGIGIVGENAPVEGAWKYNVNNYLFAWTYEKNGIKYDTYGYQGMEIYRYTVERIKENLGNWLKEYVEKEV